MRRMTAAWCSRCLWCDGHADHTAIGGDGIHHPPPAAGETCKTCGCERPPADMTDPGEVRHPLAITRDGTRYLLVTTSADSEQLHDGRPSIHVTASYVAADRMTDRDRLAHEALAAGTEHHIAAATADVLDAMHRLAAAVAATADRHGLRKHRRPARDQPRDRPPLEHPRRHHRQRAAAQRAGDHRALRSSRRPARRRRRLDSRPSSHRRSYRRPGRRRHRRRDSRRHHPQHRRPAGRHHRPLAPRRTATYRHRTATYRHQTAAYRHPTETNRGTLTA